MTGLVLVFPLQCLALVGLIGVCATVVALCELRMQPRLGLIVLVAVITLPALIWSWRGEFTGWLAQENLPDLTLHQSTAIFRASGGSRAAEFKANPIEEIRDTLDFLLYDDVKLEGRFDECAAEGGGFKLMGAGKEFSSYVLCLQDPSLFAVWNSNSGRVLRRTGILKTSMRTGPIGIQYLDVLDCLARLRYSLGFPDYMALDAFSYVMARRGSPAKANG